MEKPLSQEDFNSVMQKVRQYCEKPEVRCSSRLDFSFPEYQQLVALGIGALPYLRELIGRDNEPRWHVFQACYDILRNNGRCIEFPKEILGRLRSLEAHLLPIVEETVR